MKYKVLVVDDEFLIRMTLEGGLSDLGYQVNTAGSISEGLTRVWTISLTSSGWMRTFRSS